MAKKTMRKTVSTHSLDTTVFDLNSTLNTSYEQTGFSELDDLSKRILFFIGAMTATHRNCRVSDVAIKSEFGTAPTVYARLALLAEGDWVEYKNDPSDRRAKLITPTKRSISVFNYMSKQLRRLMK